MKKSITLRFLKSMLAFLALSFSLSAQQPQSRLWSFPPNYIKFLPAPSAQIPLPQQFAFPDYTGQLPVFTHNAAHAPNGELLFFVVDGSIYDRNGVWMDDVNVGFSGVAKGASECLIIPVPGQCNQWMILNADAKNTSGFTNANFYYKVITLQNTQYLSSSPSFNITPPAGSMSANQGPTMAVSDLRTDGTRLLYIHWGGNVHKWRIHNNVANTPPFYDGSVYQLFAEPLNTRLRSEMELVRLPDQTYRLAFPHLTPGIIYAISVLHLDASGNTVLSANVFPMADDGIGSNADIPKGLEFSPNGQFLYFTHTGTNPIQYIDIPNNSINNLAVPLASDYRFSQIERVFDNNDALFFAGPNFISALIQPNTPNVLNWQPNFNNNNIVVPVHHNFNDGAGANQSIRLLVDQRDGEDYNLAFNTSAGCCVANTVFTVDNFTAATGVQTWTPTNNPFGGTTSNPVSTVTVRNQLIIPPASNITIQGMTFKFAPRTFNPNTAGAHVEVRRALSPTGTGIGGRLVLDAGTIFTSYDDCGTGMWEGIWVQGYGTGFSVSQGNFNTSKMGWLIVKNSSRVQNAYRGAVTAQITNPFVAPPTIPGYTSGTEGGVIQGFNQARFRNNEIGVMFLNYDYPAAAIDNNVSFFSNCFFETTLALNDINLTNPFAQAFLWGVKGISFTGNDFLTNTNTSPYSPQAGNSGIGIYSINSRFTVTPICLNLNCTLFDKNIFTDLWYGIAAANIFSTKTVYIDRADFNNNYNGCLLSGINYATVLRSNFKVLKVPTFINPAAYGLYLNYARGFKVEENDFSYFGPTTPSANSFGIIVNQSNAQRSCGLYDEIYNNKFHSILVGTQAQGNNSEKPNIGGQNPCYSNFPIPNNIGLVFKCNEYFNNMDAYDIRVVDMSPTIRGNIAYQQGTCIGTTGPAANLFSHDCNFSESDYAIQATCTAQNPTAINYSHNTNNPTTIVPTCFTPFTTSLSCPGGSGLVFTNCSIPYNKPTSCPSKITGPCLNCNRQAIIAYQQQIDSANALLAAGNAQSLYNAISGNTSNGNLKNILINAGPYLSDGVLTAYLQRANTPPPGHIKQVIVANSPVTSNVMTVLNSMSLPAGIKNEINYAQTGVSARSELEGFISYSIGQRVREVEDMIRTFLNDTTIDSGVDSVVAILNTYQVPEVKCALVRAHFDRGDTASARTIVNQLLAANQEESFCKLADILLQLENPTRACVGLPVSPNVVGLTARIDSIARDTGRHECVDAQALLRIAFGLIFSEVVIPIDENQQNRIMSPEIPESAEQLSLGKIYPNPNAGNMIFAYNLKEDENGIFEILDVTGRIITSYKLPTGEHTYYISENGLNTGLYLCRYLVNGEIISSEKLVIVK